MSSALRLARPRVHRDGRAWWGGDRAWVARMGPAPDPSALAHVAERVSARTHERGAWRAALRGRAAHAVPADALVVLAGQQPILGGGPALVVHKAATAVALAHELARAWRRPVVPVFWIATQDHDGSEIDHLDLIDPGRQALRRLAVRVRPGHDAFWRSTWDEASYAAATSDLAALARLGAPWRAALATQTPGAPFSAHVAALLDEVFGDAGLTAIDAHEIEPHAHDVLERALAEPERAREPLAEGARAMADLGLPVAFDPQDPRPLVLESRDGRRQRLAAGDADARARLRRHPDDFSPHAALRPILQARALPVVAQVVGPSELLYLGQARGLHEAFDAEPPLLVPRLEATRITADELESLRHDPERAGRWLDGPEAVGDLAAAERAFLAAARVLEAQVLEAEPSLVGRARRFHASVERGARRLAAAPAWRRSGHGRRSDTLRPRNRHQDTVLAWIPDAARTASAAVYGRHLVSLAQPLDPPAHVLHALPILPSS